MTETQAAELLQLLRHIDTLLTWVYAVGTVIGVWIGCLLYEISISNRKSK